MDHELIILGKLEAILGVVPGQVSSLTLRQDLLSILVPENS